MLEFGSKLGIVVCLGILKTTQLPVKPHNLSLVMASQSERHLSADVIGNSSTKMVLPVDQTEVKKVAKKFRFAEKKVAALEPLTALCRFGKDAEILEIQPYYQRLEDAEES